MSHRFFIYGLFDPRTTELRYVGKGSTTLAHRLAAHLTPSSLKDRTLKNGWLKSLLKKGFKPEACELEDVAGDVDEAERFWIASMRAIGCNLTNMTNGGDGQTGIVRSAEWRANISAATRGRAKPKWTAERHARHRPNIGWKKSPEAVAKTAAAHRGRRYDAAVRERNSAAQKKLWTSSHAARMSRAHGGQPFVDHLENRYETVQGAARATGIAASQISRILRGLKPFSGGFTFRYLKLA